MSQSDPARETDPHALPNVETWKAIYGHCRCGAMMSTIALGENSPITVPCQRMFDNIHACNEPVRLTKKGWLYWFRVPGCLPESDPIGPFDTEAEALEAARGEN